MRYCLVCLLGTLFLGPAGASSLQPLGEIRAQVDAFLRARMIGQTGRVRIRVDTLDPRLRLRACGQALALSLPTTLRSAGRVLVHVRCAGPQPWKLYVGASVARFQNVVVLARAVARGDTLTPDHLRSEPRDIGALRGGYFVDLNAVVGLKAKRALALNNVLTRAVVAAPRWVRRGQRVVVLAKIGALEVRMPGKALADGRAGDRVRVRNDRSRRIIEGTVIRKGVVRVTL